MRVSILLFTYSWNSILMTTLHQYIAIISGKNDIHLLSILLKGAFSALIKSNLSIVLDCALRIQHILHSWGFFGGVFKATLIFVLI